MNFAPDLGYEREDLYDVMNRPMTVSLFVETSDSIETAIFTTKDQDVVKDGKTYHSLKRLFLEEGDPVQYRFATKYLANWKHWQKLKSGKELGEKIAGWEEELELKLASEALEQLIVTANSEGSFQATKFLIDRGYNKRAVGRPSKKSAEKEKRFKEQMLKGQTEFDADAKRLMN